MMWLLLLVQKILSAKAYLVSCVGHLVSCVGSFGLLLAAVYARTRWWQGPNQTIFLHRENSNTITLAIGPNRDSLQPLADSLPGAIREEEQEE